MRYNLRSGLVCAIFTINQSAYAWWDQGHQLVAELAQKAKGNNKTPFLSSIAKSSAQTLLNEQISDPGSVTLSENTNTFTKAASWADAIKSYRAKKSNSYYECHYTDTPITQLTAKISYQDALSNVQAYYAQNKHDYNSISCLKSAIKTLMTQSASTVEKSVSLRMIIHIIGDIAQPLHAAEYSEDRGGNEIKLEKAIQVKITSGAYQNVLNLHSLWDSTFGHFPQYVYNPNDVKYGIFSESDVNTVITEAQLMLKSPTLKRLPVNNYEASDVSVEGWHADSYVTAQNTAYYELPLTGKTNSNGFSYISIDTDSEYFSNNETMVETAIYKGSVHLAKLLTAIFDPDSAESGYINLINEIMVDDEVSLFPPS